MLAPTLLPLKRRQPDNVCLSLCVSKILNRFISLSRFSTFDLSPLDPLPLWPQLSLQNVLTHTCTSRVHDDIIFIAERMIMMSSCSLVYSIWPFDLWSFTSWLNTYMYSIQWYSCCWQAWVPQVLFLSFHSCMYFNPFQWVYPHSQVIVPFPSHSPIPKS